VRAIVTRELDIAKIPVRAVSIACGTETPALFLEDRSCPQALID